MELPDDVLQIIKDFSQPITSDGYKYYLLRNARLEIEELKQKIVKLESQPTIVAVPITACECSDLKAQIQSLKLQLAAEKRISQKYARDLQEKDKQQSVLTAM